MMHTIIYNPRPGWSAVIMEGRVSTRGWRGAGPTGGGIPVIARKCRSSVFRNFTLSFACRREEGEGEGRLTGGRGMGIGGRRTRANRWRQLSRAVAELKRWHLPEVYGTAANAFLSREDDPPLT